MARIALLVSFMTLGFVGQVAAAPVMTPFDPERHGFRFANTFQNDAVPALDIRTNGLCGGMSYAALDYYFAGRPIPAQDYRPANRTPLQSYLYQRQVHSITANVVQWAELGTNPGGIRNGEFFRWGLETKPGSRIAELRSFLDRGVPVPLGLQGARSKSHQVIAIGYDLGRYAGNLGPNQEDVRIFIVDPNRPGKRKVLIPDLTRQQWRLQDDPSSGWQSYFVDGHYKPRTPPAIANPVYPKDGKLYELLLTFTTGKDDLRGGNDNVDVMVNLHDGSQQIFRNVNLRARWLSSYSETVRIVLTPPVPRAGVKDLVISTTFRGGIGGDNWDMSALKVRAIGGGIDEQRFASASGGHRFTGHAKQLVVPVSAAGPGSGSGSPAAGTADRIEMTFHTRDDDLRGGNDNVDVEIAFKDGAKQLFENVNRSARWPDHTARRVRLPLNRAVPPALIEKIEIRTTFGGGIGGDNWTMKAVEARAVGGTVNKVIASHERKRFTGRDRVLILPCAP